MIVILLLTIIASTSTCIDQYVDLIELNHYFDKRGSLVYEQVIFYERTPTTGRFQVMSWCLANDEQPNRRPAKNETSGLYQVDWFDTDQRLLRKITSRLYRESWTQTDPERDNKRVHPDGLRIGLVKRFEAVE